MPLNQISLFSQDRRNPHMVHCTTLAHSNHILHKHQSTFAAREHIMCSHKVVSQDFDKPRVTLCAVRQRVSNSLVVSIKLCMSSIPQLQMCCHESGVLVESCSQQPIVFCPCTRTLRLPTKQAGMRQCLQLYCKHAGTQTTLCCDC